jgi:hypothetical protein
MFVGAEKKKAVAQVGSGSVLGHHLVTAARRRPSSPPAHLRARVVLSLSLYNVYELT